MHDTNRNTAPQPSTIPTLHQLETIIHAGRRWDDKNKAIKPTTLYTVDNK